MHFRIQRLTRVSRIVPQAIRRFVGTQARGTFLESASAPEASSVESNQIEVSQVHEASRDSPREKKASAVVTDPPLHPVLSPEYVAGGVIQQSQDALDKLDEKLCPKWDEGGIILKVQGFSASVINRLPHLWLRDNCRCATCVNQDTLQRAFDTFAIDKKIIPEVVTTEKKGLKITWEDDGHISIYPWDWIFRHGPSTAVKPTAISKPSNFWDASIAADPPSVPYEEVMASDAGIGKMLSKIREYGFTYVDGCPVSPEKTQELLERIAFIRETHYGGFYDFTADLTMKDTAYTNLALPAHTDNTYFSDPSGLQAFHLLSHTDGDGGGSLLVDGFHAASILAKESPQSYSRLAAFPISWHASGNEGTTIVPFKKFPVLEFGDKKEGEKLELLRVRWNNDDRGVVDLKGDLGMTAGKWYEAAREWNGVLKRKDMEYWSQLKPGRPLIFDNWRILHGRSAFTGKRRMCGAYINRDDYISRWRNTNYTREEALSQIL